MMEGKDMAQTEQISPATEELASMFERRGYSPAEALEEARWTMEEERPLMLAAGMDGFLYGIFSDGWRPALDSTGAHIKAQR